MAFIGRLHPLLVHFPIALVLVAAISEAAAAVTADRRWRTVAVGNVRAGAAFALVAAVAGWRLALAPNVEASGVLEWHRWLGTIGAGLTLTAALATAGASGRSRLELWIYRLTLAGASALVAAAGHLGGALVWGPDFLRP